MELAWDIQQFDNIQRNYPEDVEPLGYAAINVCIAAASLRNWTVSQYVEMKRADGALIKEADVTTHIYRYVTQQVMCEAIANTAKHARFSEGKWTGGSVRIDFEEPSEDDPGGLILRHLHDNGAMPSIALNAFMSLETNWWGELQNLGFAFSRSPPGWRQREIRKIFGHIEVPMP